DGAPRSDPGAHEEERWRRARLDHIRQELLAPVTAIAGYAGMLQDEAIQLELREMAPDLDRILAAAESLRGLVEQLLGFGIVADPGACDDAATVQERLRHDLRNPLNALQGYGEMLLEDLDDLGGNALRRDLEKLLAESARLLSSLDAI